VAEKNSALLVQRNIFEKKMLISFSVPLWILLKQWHRCNGNFFSTQVAGICIRLCVESFSLHNLKTSTFTTSILNFNMCRRLQDPNNKT
jgi:hypothetical protein